MPQTEITGVSGSLHGRTRFHTAYRESGSLQGASLTVQGRHSLYRGVNQCTGASLTVQGRHSLYRAVHASEKMYRGTGSLQGASRHMPDGLDGLI